MTSGGGNRSGQDGTFEAEAYEDDDALRPEDLMDSEQTGAAPVDGNFDGFHQPTAMFDKGQFLGELAELVDGSPDTKAAVEAEAAPPRGCRLIVVDGPEIGMEWSFKVPEINIGRDEDCEIVFSDIAISRRHARLALEGESFFLYDLDSGNGVFLNGARIQREQLAPGDEISVGDRTLRFVELNETPSTAAAHPVPPVAPEPMVGDPGGADQGFEPIGRGSRVGVEAADLESEPSSQSRLPVGSAPGRPRGQALRMVAGLVGAIVVLAAVLAGGWWVYRRYFAGETPAQRIARAQREFLQGIALVKAKRCGDAVFMFDRVLAIRPEYVRAKDYKAHCTKEIEAWRRLEVVRGLAGQGRHLEALETLGAFEENSAYTTEARLLAERCHRSLASDLVNEARERWAEDDIDGALELLGRALEHAPDHVGALDMKQQIEGARAVLPPPPPSKKSKPTIPPRLIRVVTLYRKAKIGAAIDAAEVVGGTEAETYILRMRKVKRFLADAEFAHRKKAAAEVLRIVPAALQLDGKVGHGEGEVRRRLNRIYADGLYLKGIEALQSGDDVKGYRLLSQAMRVHPGHKLAKSRIAALQGQAREIYYEGFATKDTDPSATRRAFRRLVQITDPKDPFHKLASKWLRKNGG